jgi:uncharacterized protein with HEPN domain
MARALIPRLTDMVEAIERIRGVLRDTPLEAFEADWQKQWLVERGVLIVSEASRHLADEMKARHPEIPWTKVAGIGNVLRHSYENVAAPIMWKLVQVDLPILQEVCQTELTRTMLAEDNQPEK